MIKKTVKNDRKYDDIIDMEYPLKTSDRKKHAKMPLEDRAKIFAPFAALKGYNEAIEQKQKTIVPKKELSEEFKELMDQRITVVQKMLELGVHPIITIIYFQKEIGSVDEKGDYIKFTGKVVKYNATSRTLQVVDKKIVLDNIVLIESDEFHSSSDFN